MWCKDDGGTLKPKVLWIQSKDGTYSERRYVCIKCGRVYGRVRSRKAK